MRALSAREIIGVWELSQHQTPIDKALTILAIACPDRSAEELAALSIGQRDLRLLLLRERTIGPSLQSVTECPRCHERLEFGTTVRDICVDSMSDEHKEFTLREDGYEVRFRLLDSNDQRSILDCDDLDQARLRLARRCVIEARRDGEAIAGGRLPEHVVELLAEKVAEYDPQAEILFNLTCGVCKHKYQVFFDVATYFVDELRSTVVRLLREVHYIARAYGWSEEQILAMSDAKRKFYLEMV